MSQFAKLFQNGSSRPCVCQENFASKVMGVRIRRLGKSVLLEPVADDPEAWLAGLKKVPADPEFMKARRQPKLPGAGFLNELSARYQCLDSVRNAFLNWRAWKSISPMSKKRGS